MSDTFSDFNSQRPKLVWDPGITARSINGERITMALVDLDPDAPLPEHNHENEQVGFVVQGGLTLTIGGETRTLGPGDTYLIPSNVVHGGVTGPEGAVVCDVFSPPRADWERIKDGDPGPSDWPPR
jgi:quercetin dioxygenase-like cupin family protein